MWSVNFAVSGTCKSASIGRSLDGSVSTLMSATVDLTNKIVQHFLNCTTISTTDIVIFTQLLDYS